jgi:hypothetical protein
MPVYKLEAEMPYTELLKWISWFRDKPIGWREDYRTYMLMSSMGYKGKPESAFTTLRTIKEAEDKHNKEDMAVPSGQFLNKMLSAVNGDKSNFFLGGK